MIFSWPSSHNAYEREFAVVVYLAIPDQMLVRQMGKALEEPQNDGLFGKAFEEICDHRFVLRSYRTYHSR